MGGSTIGGSKKGSNPGGGGVHKHFFDRDARPRTNFNYSKYRMTLNSNPKK